MKTVSDRVFELIKQRGMTQKEFSQLTGIAESTISDWKRKKNNPVSDKILIICEVLDVTPYELLSGAEGKTGRSRDNMTYVVDKKTEIGYVIESFQRMDERQRTRLIGYMEALMEIKGV